jgi:hypothetical protein
MRSEVNFGRMSVSVTNSIWLFGVLFQMGIILTMHRSKLFKELPVFFGYTVFQTLRALGLAAVKAKGSPALYFYAYWSAEACSNVVAFFVINEIFRHMLRPYEGIKHIASLLLKWAVMVLVVISLIVGFSSTRNEQLPYITSILVLERCVRLIQCGLLLFLFAFASALSITWKHYLFGIALGFGILAATQTVITSMLSAAGASGTAAYILLKPGMYLFVLGLWLYYLAHPVPLTREAKVTTFVDLTAWNRALLEIIQR